MVVKTKTKAEKKRKVIVGKLMLNKETVQDLTKTEAKKVEGGLSVSPPTARITCATCPFQWGTG